MLAVGDVTRAYARVGIVLSDPDADWYDFMDAATVLLITSHAVAQVLHDSIPGEGREIDGDGVRQPLEEMDRALQWVMRCGRTASREAVRTRLEEAWQRAGTVLDRLPASNSSPPS